MSLVVTLEISEDTARWAREIAARTQRRFEDVLVEWIDQSAAEPPVESLSDAEVLALCDLQMMRIRNSAICWRISAKTV